MNKKIQPIIDQALDEQYAVLLERYRECKRRGREAQRALYALQNKITDVATGAGSPAPQPR